MPDGTGTLPIIGDTAAVFWIKTGGDQGQPETPGGNNNIPSPISSETSPDCYTNPTSQYYCMWPSLWGMVIWLLPLGVSGWPWPPPVFIQNTASVSPIIGSVPVPAPHY